MLKRTALGLVLMACGLIAQPSWGASPITGKIQAPTFPSNCCAPEVAAYIQQGCAGNYTNAVAAAVVDLKEANHTIKLTLTAVENVIGLQSVYAYALSACDISKVAPYALLGEAQGVTRSVTISRATRYVIVGANIQGLGSHFKIDILS